MKDSLMTQLQETGEIPVMDLDVQTLYEIVTELGLDPRNVMIVSFIDGPAALIVKGDT